MKKSEKERGYALRRSRRKGKGERIGEQNKHFNCYIGKEIDCLKIIKKIQLLEIYFSKLKHYN